MSQQRQQQTDTLISRAFDVVVSSPILLAVGDLSASGDASFDRVISVGVSPRPDVSASALVLVSLDDTHDGDLLGVLDECIAAVREAAPGDRLLVHCHAGQSRSVAVCIALLMVFSGLRVDLAASLVISSRPGACPNASFAAQLLLLDALLHGEQSTLPGFRGGNAAAVVRTLRAWWAVCAGLPHSRHLAPWLLDEGGGGGELRVGGRGGGSTTLEEEEECALLRARAEALLAERLAVHGGGRDPLISGLLLQGPASEAGGAGRRRFCCGRCNALLFTDAHVTALHGGGHGGAPPPQQPAAAAGGPSPPPRQDPRCSLVSIEPPRSLAERGSGGGSGARAALLPALLCDKAAGPQSGHLVCARCGAKAGGWDWSARSVACECGVSLFPATFAVLSRLIVRG